MIAASPALGYIHEPFNPAHSLGIFNVPVNRYFTWVSDHNGHLYEAALADTLDFKYNTWAAARSLRNAKGLARMLMGYSRSRLYRSQERRPLLKDPLALFAAEWIAAKFDAQVVVLVRHPAAFVNSVIKGDLRHRFSQFLEQPGFMAAHLTPFREEIEFAARREIDILDEGILLWRITHHFILKCQRAHPDWLFVRHEDLSRAPLTEFERIFVHLGLDYTPVVQKNIEDYSREGNPIERLGTSRPYVAKLDSRQNANRWTHRLSPGQVERIRQQSKDVWPAFYADDDWEADGLGEPAQVRAAGD